QHSGTAGGAGGQGGDTSTGGVGLLQTTGSGGECAPQCSKDLHEVRDCDGKLVKTCPLDQGCANGECIPSCDAATSNMSSIGCDYYVVAPDVIDEERGACFAAFIANTWGAPVTLSIERGGNKLDLSKSARIASGDGEFLSYAPLPKGKLPPGEVA